MLPKTQSENVKARIRSSLTYRTSFFFFVFLSSIHTYHSRDFRLFLKSLAWNAMEWLFLSRNKTLNTEHQKFIPHHRLSSKTIIISSRASLYPPSSPITLDSHDWWNFVGSPSLILLCRRRQSHFDFSLHNAFHLRHRFILKLESLVSKSSRRGNNEPIQIPSIISSSRF